jgi:lipid A disaccharide synthetase
MEAQRVLQTSARPALWGEYFDLAQYRADDERVQLIQQLYHHLLTPAGAATLNTLSHLPTGKYTISVNCDALVAQSGIANLEDALKAQPEVVLQCLSVAIGEVGPAS